MVVENRQTAFSHDQDVVDPPVVLLALFELQLAHFLSEDYYWCPWEFVWVREIVMQRERGV